MNTATAKIKYLLIILSISTLFFGSCCPPFCPQLRCSLSPPTVVPPLYACATAVTVQGFIPGATIDIYADGVRIGGGVSDSPWGQSFSVSPDLVAGQFVHATQTDTICTSPQSDLVEVVSYFETHPEGLPKPILKTPLYECGGAIGVSNLARGGLLEVFVDDVVSGHVNGCGAGQWLFVSNPFIEGQRVYAIETLCDIRGPRSDVAIVQAAPSSLPQLDVGDVYDGGKYVNVYNITNGALVKVYDGTQQIAGHYCSGGGQIFRLNPQPSEGDILTATQELCALVSDPSDPVVVKSCSELPAPSLDSLCAGSDKVTVSGTAPDARIRIYADGELIGDGGGVLINLIRSLNEGEVIKATQSLGTCTSPYSDPVVVSVSAAPQYNPSYWNNPSIVGCNNCYNYATDIRTDTYAQPGYAHGVSHSTNCPTVSSSAQADGLVVTNIDQTCRGCTHIVALVIAPGEDYHWYRLDDTGRWSHKMGGWPVSDRDGSGSVINNPETADRRVFNGPDFIRDYSIFCGYFCVDKNNVVIDGRLLCN